MKIPFVSIKWMPSWRIIADRYPPIDFFERVANPEDWETLLALESLTNPGAQAGLSNIHLIPVADRISGPGAGLILPSFVFLDPNPPGSRFSNSQFDAYYAAKEFDMAFAEAKYRQELFMLEGDIKKAQDVDQLIILADIVGKFHDVRGKQNKLPEIYNVSDYSASQALATRLRAEDGNGIVYNSVRNLKGECIAVFRPKYISNARVFERMVFQWSGQKIVGYYKKFDYHQI